MKVIAIMICSTALSISLCADKKWIPIEPIVTDQNAKTEKNASNAGAGNQWIENIKTLQKLLDKKGHPDETEGGEKSWYSLDNTENN